MTVPDDTRDELIEKELPENPVAVTAAYLEQFLKAPIPPEQIADFARHCAQGMATAGLLADPGLRAELERLRGQLAEAIEMVKTCTGHPDRANPEIPSHPELLQAAHAERDALMEEIQGYQGDGAYEKGWEHGAATAAKLKAERDERQARLDAALALTEPHPLRHSYTSRCFRDVLLPPAPSSAVGPEPELPLLSPPRNTARPASTTPFWHASPPVPASGEAETKHDGGEA